MNGFSLGLEAVDSLADASIGFVLVAKWTVVLALAWLGHAALWHRDPRWRVVLWRGSIVGVAIVAVLSFGPPILAYHLARGGRAAVAVVPAVPRAAAVEGRSATARELIGVVDSAPAPASVDRTRSGDSLMATSRTTVPAPMSPAAAPGNRWGIRASGWLLSIWLIGALTLIVRLIVGSSSLTRLVRRSADAPVGVARECRAIADRLGCSRAVRVRRSAEVQTPFLTGLWHPVLLLPERPYPDDGNDELRAILAHELTHARNLDLAWNLAANIASILLWFHPLAWRIRAAHVGACEAVCDAVAADTLGDVASYGRILARLAVRAAGVTPVHGLAMARASDVRGRLDALKRRVYHAPLSWGRVVPAFLAGTVLLVLIGGLGLTRAEQAAPVQRADQGQFEAVPRSDAAAKPADERSAAKLTIRAVAAETGEPIEGVSISYWGRFGDKRQEATIITEENGTATIEWAAGTTVHRLGFTAREPHFVPIHVLWDDERHPLNLPSTKELRLESGKTIGGLVRDEAGHPIEGATVEVVAPATESERSSYFFALGSPNTDAQGRWRLNVAPTDLTGVSCRVSHPDYRNNGRPASRDLDSVIVLTKGLTVSGRVVDAAGRPVPGARAIIGHDIWGTDSPTASTDERGEFTLKNCQSGRSVVTVQAAGFAPQVQDVQVEEHTAALEFRMTEPGAVLRVRVIDVHGKPVAGARVSADTWRGHRSINFRADTDAQGRVEWRSAPRDPVLYGVFKEDYMAIRDIGLSASENEQNVTLYPELVISGRVTDGDTRQPVPKFRVVTGWHDGGWQRGVHWTENMGVDATGGQYACSFRNPREALFVKIEAPGYKTAESRAFRPNEGRQTLDFTLERAAGIAGLVLLPDGKPAERAEVALSTWRNEARLQLGRFHTHNNSPRTTTGSDGRFWFPPVATNFLLVAIHDDGYADASSEEFAKSGKLVLQTWGRIEGGARIGSRFGAHEEIAFYPIRPEREVNIGDFSYGYSTLTDERGRFQFDRVVPGPGRVVRVVYEFRRPGRAFRLFPCWQERVEVKAGQTVQVTLGGKGRPVIGRIVLDGTPEAPVDWTDNEPVLLGVPSENSDPRRFGLLFHASTLFASYIDKDGRFRIDDVPAGKYELELAVNGPGNPRFGGPGEAIARLKMSVVVPEIPGGRSNEPLDLGTLTVKLFDAIKIGDVAPEFDVERIGRPEKGRRVKLSDYRGKLVLLNFCNAGDTETDLIVLEEVQQAFGSDPRFVLISLVCRDNAAQAERTNKPSALSWTQGVAGDFSSGVTVAYKVRAIPGFSFIGADQQRRRIPLTFLIGPDGRVLAHDLAATELEAVRQALNNPKLFPPAPKAANRPGSR